MKMKVLSKLDLATGNFILVQSLTTGFCREKNLIAHFNGATYSIHISGYVPLKGKFGKKVKA